MDYCAGVWGFALNDQLDKIHMRSIRCFLGVNQYATKVGVEGDLGWVPPQIHRHLDMLRQWNRLVSMAESRLPKVLYHYMLKKK